MKIANDKIILGPDDIDLKFSPIRKSLNVDTYVLGAFNPGMARLPNGNLIIMVRVAEALKDADDGNFYRVIRWDKEYGYKIDLVPNIHLEKSDPRKFIISLYQNKSYCLTSSSWLLPVELSADGESIVQFHYDKCIIPEKAYQEFGIEDARISFIEDRYYMTTCSVGSARHSTVLYSSHDGIDYKLMGMIMDHQNKDMTLFPKKIDNYYYALTRPTGEHSFASDINSPLATGPSIFLSSSPNLLHWKPEEDFEIRPHNNSKINLKLGSGAPPVEFDDSWLIIFHGVENQNNVGIYRSFICLLDKNNPVKIKKLNYDNPLLESNPELTIKYSQQKYLNNVVFTSGIAEDKDKFIIASGELDLCCRITHIEKNEMKDFIRNSSKIK